MSELALFCQLVVAGVLAVSGTSKLLDPAGTRDAVEAFGVPERASRAVAALLPLVELLVSAALVAAPGRRGGAAAALLLLGGFTVLVLDNLRRGRHPQCHCFGRLGSSDISARTVLRNLLLMVMALVAALTPTAGWGEDGERRTAADLALLVLAAAAATAAVVLAEAHAGRRSAGRRTAAADAGRVDDPVARTAPAGRAPHFELPTLGGSSVSSSDLHERGRPVLLAFLSPGCGSCKRLRPVVRRWSAVFQDRLTVVVVTHGDPAAVRASFGDTDAIVLLDEDRAVGAAYGISTTPAAVAVGPTGDLLGAAALGETSIRRLVADLIDGRRDDARAADLTLSARPGPRSTVTTTGADDGTCVLTDETTAASVALDRVGALVWQCLDGRSTLHDVATDIAAGFGAPPHVVAGDVLRLVRQLGAAGLLDGVAPDASAVVPPQHVHGVHAAPVGAAAVST